MWRCSRLAIDAIRSPRSSHWPASSLSSISSYWANWAWRALSSTAPPGASSSSIWISTRIACSSSWSSTWPSSCCSFRASSASSSQAGPALDEAETPEPAPAPAAPRCTSASRAYSTASRAAAQHGPSWPGPCCAAPSSSAGAMPARRASAACPTSKPVARRAAAASCSAKPSSLRRARSSPKGPALRPARWGSVARSLSLRQATSCREGPSSGSTMGRHGLAPSACCPWGMKKNTAEARPP
mmetsp:Transcript_30222/g.80389  ORF Transcript_30222/g.80389 Transcript_30222/m.80389 type:complete len:242 (-) Transcript_30222:2453-3178(-)